MNEGFSLDFLPPTVKNAVAMTWKLSIRYLWLDCLCIIRHNVDDKTAEINNMGNIYKYATTIIAVETTASV